MGNVSHDERTLQDSVLSSMPSSVRPDASLTDWNTGVVASSCDSWATMSTSMRCPTMVQVTRS
jgi:hypothetical protein